MPLLTFYARALAADLIHIKRFSVCGFAGGERCGVATASIAADQRQGDGWTAPLLCGGKGKFSLRPTRGMAFRVPRREHFAEFPYGRKQWPHLTEVVDN